MLPPRPWCREIPSNKTLLFDLANGGDKEWGGPPPYRELGRRAIAAASRAFAPGNAGAGPGVRVGRLKGGIGGASTVAASGLQAGALVAVNTAGSTVIPGTRTLWASLFEQAGEMDVPLAALPAGGLDLDMRIGGFAAGNTATAVVATNVRLDAAQGQRVSIMAHDGLARAIRPLHTPFDGDTVFAPATGTHAGPVDPAVLAMTGTMAADCLTRAVSRAMTAAQSLGDMPCYRDRCDEGGRTPVPET